MKFGSNRLSRARPLLGTFVEITATGSTAREVEAGIEAAFAAIKRVHDRMSFHDPESDVSRLNRASPGRSIRVDNWTYQVLQLSLMLQRTSQGCFNIGIAPALQLLGLLPTSIGEAPSAVPRASTAAVELLSGNRVRKRDPASKIDLGGIAKGFAVDRAVEVLRERGITGGLVNAGGDLAAFGANEHAVDIRNPRHPTRLMCRVAIRDAALASSGLRFDPIAPSAPPRSAIIDTQNFQPTRAIFGATVRAACCAIADALTKVVMTGGTRSSEILDCYHASALLVTASGEVAVTNDWQGAFSIAT